MHDDRGVRDHASHACRAARTGRNPATGEAVQIPAKKLPKFKPGAALKDAVNG